MRLAFVTPWPNDQTGIADYVHAVVVGLKKYPLNITIYSTSESPALIDGVKIVSGSPTEWDLTHHDLIIYHIGNNHRYHGHMPDLLKRFPGVVHMHDYVLQHLFSSAAGDSKNWSFYMDTMHRLYGESIADEARMKLASPEPFWERKDVLDFPLCEPILERSRGVIVHSRFLLEKIRSKFPMLPVALVSQSYPKANETRSLDKSPDFRIGVFGHLHPNRNVDLLLRSLQRVANSNKTVQVRLVGPANNQEYLSSILAMAESLAPRVQLQHIGYADDTVFLDEIASCDVCCALRFPTLGETSAVVARAVQFGKPTIVSRVGWYAELPDCIPKIDHGKESELQLAGELSKLMNDPVYYRRIAGATKAFAENEYDFDASIEKSFNIYHGMYNAWNNLPDRDCSTSFITNAISQTLTDLGLDSKEDEGGVRAAVYRNLDFCFQG